jgi:hypothetical protein
MALFPWPPWFTSQGIGGLIALSASYRNGVLTVTLSKSAPAALGGPHASGEGISVRRGAGWRRIGNWSFRWLATFIALR